MDSLDRETLNFQTDAEHFAGQCLRLDNQIKALRAELERVAGERDVLATEMLGFVEESNSFPVDTENVYLQAAKSYAHEFRALLAKLDGKQT